MSYTRRRHSFQVAVERRQNLREERFHFLQECLSRGASYGGGGGDKAASERVRRHSCDAAAPVHSPNCKEECVRVLEKNVPSSCPNVPMFVVGNERLDGFSNERPY